MTVLHPKTVITVTVDNLNGQLSADFSQAVPLEYVALLFAKVLLDLAEARQKAAPVPAPPNGQKPGG